MERRTQNSIDIKAPPEAVYMALTDPRALVQWQVPYPMKARMHHFDLRPGGGYEMSLFYPPGSGQGKSGANEDRYSATFLELKPGQKVVQTVRFDTNRPEMTGEMRMEAVLDPIPQGTRVTLVFSDIPIGIALEDNEAGTRSSLEKLARLLENR